MKRSDLEKEETQGEDNGRVLVSSRYYTLLLDPADKTMPLEEFRRLLPSYATDGAAGLDFRASETTVCRKGEVTLVPTGIEMEIMYPLMLRQKGRGFYGKFHDRSSVVTKKLLEVRAGVIDEDYRGHVKVALYNFGPTDCVVEKYERITQMIISEYIRVGVESCHPEEKNDGNESTQRVLTETKRGAGGFGSTGQQ